ncbi:MAG: hypothetical protein VCA36_02670 [Opitutales bacterium]
MVGQLAFLVLAATETRIPLPKFALASAREAMRKKGLEIDFEEVTFTLKGTVHGEGVVLRTTNEKVLPLVAIDHVVMEVRPWDYMMGKGYLSNIEIQRAEALFLEQDRLEPILTHLNLRVRPKGDLSVFQLRGQIGEASIWCDGKAAFANLFPKRKGPPKLPLFKRPDFPERYASLLRALGQVKSHLTNADRAFIATSLSRVKDKHVFTFHGQAWKGASEGSISFDHVVTHFGLRQQGTAWVLDNQPEVKILNGRIAGIGSTSKAEFLLHDVNCSLKELSRELRAKLHLEGLRIEGRHDGKLEHLDGEINVHELDHIEGEFLAQAKRFNLEVDAEYLLSAQSGSVNARGELFPQDLDSEHFRKLDRTNELRAPSGISLLMAEASLGEWGRILDARMRVKGRDVTWRGVKANRASIVAKYSKGGEWLLNPMIVRVGDSFVEGSYDRNSTRDYRFLLKGFVQPETINPWMGKWWLRMWKDFEIGNSPLAGDFDLGGRWRNPEGNRLKVFGSVKFNSLSYRKMPVDTGSVIVFADSNRTTARNLDLILEKGWVKGEMSWEKGSKDKGSTDITFSLEGSVNPADCLEVFGPSVKETLSKFKSEETIDVQATGVSKNDDNGTTYELKVNSNHPLSYANVPLDALAFELYRKGKISKVKNLNFQFAGGLAKGSLVHSGSDGNSSLYVDIELRGARRERTIEALRASKVFSTLESNCTVSPKSDEERLPDNDQSTLDFTLKAKGNPNDLSSFSGHGEFNLKDPDLGSIRLFGPLSEVLQATPLPLPSGSMNFTRIVATYVLGQDQVTSGKLDIVSSTALIRGSVKISLLNGEINFKGRLYAFGGLISKIPILGKIADFVDPLSKVVELELSGPINNPKWSLSVNPKILQQK